MGIFWLMLKVLLFICLPTSLICLRDGFSWSLWYIAQVFYQVKGRYPKHTVSENDWKWVSQITPSTKYWAQTPTELFWTNKTLMAWDKTSRKEYNYFSRSTELQNQVLKQLEALIPWEKLNCDPESVLGWKGSFQSSLWVQGLVSAADEVCGSSASQGRVEATGPINTRPAKG